MNILFFSSEKKLASVFPCILFFLLLTLFSASLCTAASKGLPDTKKIVSDIVKSVKTLPEGWGFWSQGSWTKNNRKYRNPLDLTRNISDASDHDLRLMVPKDASEEEMVRVYTQVREEIEEKIHIRFAEQGEEAIKRVRQVTNLYPPKQLMQGVETKEQAIVRLGKLGLPSPNLGGEEVEGIFNKYFKEFIAYPESKGILLLKEGSTMRQYQADLVSDLFPLEKDVYEVKNTIPGVCSNVREITEKAHEALDGGDVNILIKDLERIDNGVRRGMGLSGMQTSRSRAVRDLLKKLEAAKKLKKPLNQSLRREVESVLKSSRLQINLLERYHVSIPSSHNPAAKVLTRDQKIIKKILSDIRSSTPRGNKLVKIWKQIPWRTVGKVSRQVLEKVFVLWDTYSASEKAKHGDIEGAYRDAAVANIFLAAGLPTGLAAMATSILLDYAKQVGSSIAVMSQDCGDLLAGIIEVKGWENVASQGGKHETSTEQLAANVTSELRFRSIVENAIVNAAENSKDRKEAKKIKIEKLKARCLEPLVERWRMIRRRQLMEYLNIQNRLKEEIGKIDLQLNIAPEKAPLIHRRGGKDEAAVLAVLTVPDRNKAMIQELSDIAKQKIERLGGRRHRVLFDPQIIIHWSVDGKAEGQEEKLFSWEVPSQIAAQHFTFSKAGTHTITCHVLWQLKVFSTITDASDAKHSIFSQYGLVRKIWEVGKMTADEYYEETLHPKQVTTVGDALATYQQELGFARPRIALATCEVSESDLDDSIEAVVSGQSTALTGQTIPLRLHLHSAIRLEPDKVFYRWIGGVKDNGQTALFTENEPGIYPLRVQVFEDKAQKNLLAESPVFTIQVFSPDQAFVGLQIKGPERTNIDHDVAFKAFVSGKNKAGEQLLATGDTFIQWLSEDSILDTGNELTPTFPEPGTYTITARLIQDQDGQLQILASDSHQILVTEKAAADAAKKSPRNERSTTVSDASTETTAQTTDKPKKISLPSPGSSVFPEDAFPPFINEKENNTDNDTTAADDETFGKLADAAAKKFKNGTNKRTNFSNPPGCQLIQMQDIDRPKVDTQTYRDTRTFDARPVDESATSKQPIENTWDDDDVSGPSAPGATVDEPVLPPYDQMGDAPEAPVEEEKTTSPPQEIPKEPGPLHIRLVPQPNQAVFQPGDTVKVLACIDMVDPESLPLRFNWHGSCRFLLPTT